MHGGIDEKRKNSPCVGGEVGKRAVNKGSMNEKESAREANNRGFHESCSRVIPSFRIFRLATLGARKSFFLNRTYHNWNIFLSARRKNFSISIASLSLIPYHRVRRHATMKQPPTSTPGHTLLEQRSKFVDRALVPGYRSSQGYRYSLLSARWRGMHFGVYRTRWWRSRYSPVLDVRRVRLRATLEAELAALHDAPILAQPRPDPQRHFWRVADLEHETLEKMVSSGGRGES